MASLAVACVASAVAVYGFVRHYRSNPEVTEEDAAKTIQASVRNWAVFADRLRTKAAVKVAAESAAEVARKRNEETN